MNRLARRFRLAAFWFSVLVLACVPAGPPAQHQVLQARFEPLRSRFQADSGKVRAILLASPT